MREPKNYRRNLERVNEAFPTEMITRRAAARWLGISEPTLRKRLDNTPTKKVSKSVLARLMG